MSKEFRIAAEQRGRRLDAALSVFFPHLGLRGRRRLWKEHQVFVDGTERPPAFKVRGGELIRLARSGERESACGWCGHDPPRCLARSGAVFFLYKPSGLHTEALAGKDAPSLAALLPEIMPDVADRPILLTRLDWETSGITLAAADSGTALRLRAAENAGEMKKLYFTVLEGVLREETTVSRELDTAKRTRVRTLDEEADVLRHTRMHPLCSVDAAEFPALASAYGETARFTLAACCIRKGARHQIRAHAAHIGHPLAGDRLYGARARAVFYLHHARLEIQGGRVCCLPSWMRGLRPAAQNAVSGACADP